MTRRKDSHQIKGLRNESQQNMILLSPTVDCPLPVQAKIEFNQEGEQKAGPFRRPHQVRT